MKFIFLTPLFIATLIGSFNLMSQDFGVAKSIKYHGGKTHLRLGGGVNKNFPLKFKKTCLANPGAYDPDVSATGGGDGGLADGFGSGAQGVPETTFNIKFIEDTKELHDILSISGVIAAQFKFFGKKIPGMKLEGQMTEDLKVSKSSLNLVLKVKSNFGRQMISDGEFELKEKYQALLDAEDYEKFEYYCGSHFVAWQRRQGIVSAIFKIENLTEHEKKQIRAAFEIGSPPDSSWGDDDDDYWDDDDIFDPDDDIIDDDDDWDDDDDIFADDDDFRNLLRRGAKSGSSTSPTKRKISPIGGGMGARVSLDNYFKAAKKIGKKATLNFHATGGGGLQHLNRLTASFNGSIDSLDGVLDGIAHYLEQYSFHSAPPVEYYLEPYFDYFTSEEDIDHSLLQTIYYQYVEVESQMTKILKEMKKTKKADKGSKRTKYLAKKFNELDEIRSRLWDQSQIILKKGTKPDGSKLNLLDIPEVPEVNLAQFNPEFASADYSIDCYVKHYESEVKCGMPKNFYYYIKPVSYWEANVAINAEIKRVKYVKKVSLFMSFPGGKYEKIATLTPGQEKSVDIGSASFLDNGQVSFKFGRMTQKQNRELYVKIMDHYPKALLRITNIDGGTSDKIIHSAGIIGPNAKWKKDKKVNYDKITFKAY